MIKPPNRSTHFLSAHPSTTKVSDVPGPRPAAVVWDQIKPGVAMERVDLDDAEQVTSLRAAGAASWCRSSRMPLSNALPAHPNSRTAWLGSGT